jgi:hypothetical protein
MIININNIIVEKKFATPKLKLDTFTLAKTAK